jgi:hypothetical protein
MSETPFVDLVARVCRGEASRAEGEAVFHGIKDMAAALSASEARAKAAEEHSRGLESALQIMGEENAKLERDLTEAQAELDRGFIGYQQIVNDERARAATAEARREEAERAKDGAYRERDQVVALVARMALALGWRTGLRRHQPDPDPTWDEDWKNVVAIDLPAGQVTWHFHDSERPLFHSLPPYPGSWDGHDTAEKYRRVNASGAGAEEGR